MDSPRALVEGAPECLEPDSIQASCPARSGEASRAPPGRSEVTPEEMGTDPRREPSPPRGGRLGDAGSRAPQNRAPRLLVPPAATAAGQMASGASPGPGEAGRRDQWAQDALQGGFLPPRARRRLPCFPVRRTSCAGSRLPGMLPGLHQFCSRMGRESLPFSTCYLHANSCLHAPGALLLGQ